MDEPKPYVLVDCAVETPAIHHALIHHVESADVRAQCLFVNQRESDLAHAAPWLIDLPESEAACELTTWLTLTERRYPAITRLATKVDFDALFKHLEAQSNLTLPDGKLAMHRFWDPRAWSRLQRVLSVEQRVACMGPVLEWKVVLRGKTHCVSQFDTERNLQEQITYVDADA
ncbi:DUF4123 domain-containing protein [Paraburkholderia domus]|uniref:DUF4123 domain-containing protein n=1 Tax=Paraburkholderia domus TaxID=2793075 RepID=UPI001B25C5CD|nr:DUF4123 domain-containing protein [Paraburkholderia domus]CAE6856338.1 hypothetical protein R75483_07849 [Paraburkholderia domus]